MSRRNRVFGITADATILLGGPSMWREILRDYDERQMCDEESQISWFRRQASLRAAIETAARAVNAGGKRYDHQYRIWRESIPKATAALIAAEPLIAAAPSFDDLLHLITAQLREIAGIGEMYHYDTTFRIGAYLGKYPKRVYLHRGTREGAQKLGLDYWKHTLEMGELPQELRARQPHEVEDILCIYKDRFTGGAMPPGGCDANRRRTRRQLC